MRGPSTPSGTEREVSGTLGVPLSETFTCGGAPDLASTKGDKEDERAV